MGSQVTARNEEAPKDLHGSCSDTGSVIAARSGLLASGARGCNAGPSILSPLPLPRFCSSALPCFLPTQPRTPPPQEPRVNLPSWTAAQLGFRGGP